MVSVANSYAFLVTFGSLSFWFKPCCRSVIWVQDGEAIL